MYCTQCHGGTKQVSERLLSRFSWDINSTWRTYCSACIQKWHVSRLQKGLEAWVLFRLACHIRKNVCYFFLINFSFMESHETWCRMIWNWSFRSYHDHFPSSQRECCTHRSVCHQVDGQIPSNRKCRWHPKVTRKRVTTQRQGRYMTLSHLWNKRYNVVEIARATVGHHRRPKTAETVRKRLRELVSEAYGHEDHFFNCFPSTE